MVKKKSSSEQRREKKGGWIAPALCNLFGVALLLLVIGLCAPLTVPQLFGYQVYNVVSGSMEPEIPVGSVMYVHEAELSDVQVGEVIAFRDGGNVVAHRVTTNRTSVGEFVTKGDANDVEDLNPIPYDSVLGRVVAHIPQLGAFMAIYSTMVGKVYLLLTAACGVMLNILASWMRRSKARAWEIEQAGVAAEDGAGAHSRKRAPRRASNIVRQALIAILAVVFLGSSGVVGYVMWQYRESDEVYAKATESFSQGEGLVAPKSVDFDALRAVNPDVVGWIYCEGTVIDYPVVQGKDNDQYLHHDYTGAYNINGSIFVDADNRPGFVDGNTIIYGHHMNSGSMFATLEKWGDQAYYEEHPVMWLLTPEQDYEVVLFSGHHVNAYSNAYEIIPGPGKKLNDLLDQAQKESDFHMETEYAELIDVNHTQPDVQLNLQGRYVMLSTCAYVFDNARYALHGELVPVAHAEDDAQQEDAETPETEDAQAAEDASQEEADVPTDEGDQLQDGEAFVEDETTWE